MKISIITPSYNQAKYIGEAVESVRAQDYHSIEHLLFDNCSTDHTIDVLKKYPDLTLVCEQDHGQSDALNKGFKAATGDIIGWLNADDRYLPGCFRAVADFFAHNPQCDIVYGNYRLIDAQGQVLSMRQEIGFDLFMLKYLHVLCIPSTTVFFRRRIFEEGNYLKKEYHYAMDYEFFLRLALKGYHFAHIPFFLADFRTYPDSKSRRQTLQQKEEMEHALLEQDNSLKNIKGPWRSVIRQSLMLAARFKRCALKFFAGAYFK